MQKEDTMMHFIHKLMMTCAFLLSATFIACEKADLNNVLPKEKNTPQHPIPGEQGGPNGGTEYTPETKPETPKDTISPQLIPHPTHELIHTGDTLVCAEFLTRNFEVQVWVQGYIVGSCYKSHTNTSFSPPFKGKTSILIADSPTERDVSRLVCINLKSGYMRNTLNLVDHESNVGKRVMVFGNKSTYLGYIGMGSKSVTSSFWLLDN